MFLWDDICVLAAKKWSATEKNSSEGEVATFYVNDFCAIQ